MHSHCFAPSSHKKLIPPSAVDLHTQSRGLYMEPGDELYVCPMCVDFVSEWMYSNSNKHFMSKLPATAGMTHSGERLFLRLFNSKKMVEAPRLNENSKGTE